MTRRFTLLLILFLGLHSSRAEAIFTEMAIATLCTMIVRAIDELEQPKRNNWGNSSEPTKSKSDPAQEERELEVLRQRELADFRSRTSRPRRTVEQSGSDIAKDKFLKAVAWNLAQHVRDHKGSSPIDSTAEAVVALTFDPYGSVVEVKLIRASGSAELDRLTVRAASAVSRRVEYPSQEFIHSTVTGKSDPIFFRVNALGPG